MCCFMQCCYSMLLFYINIRTNFMYAAGAIVGLIGAVKVYQKWNSGDQDTGKVAAACSAVVCSW